MNNEMKHTPGPWEVGSCGLDKIKISKSSDSRRIATIVVKTMTIDWANACLIAAAPKLLEAAKGVVLSLKELIHYAKETGKWVSQAIAEDNLTAIENAINKATEDAQ